MMFHRAARLSAAAAILGVAFIGAENTMAQNLVPLPEDAVWTETEDGLKYSVIKPGAGDLIATPGRGVSAHYTGWLREGGNRFDSSVDRGQPFSFTVGRGVIEGWSKVVQLMPVGAKYRVEIPPELGYGARGAGGAIPPNAVLVFDIELLSVAPEPPKFQKANAEAQVTIEEGLVYEVVKAGTGPKLTADDAFELQYTIYSPEGQLLQSSVLVRAAPAVWDQRQVATCVSVDAVAYASGVSVPRRGGQGSRFWGHGSRVSTRVWSSTSSLSRS